MSDGPRSTAGKYFRAPPRWQMKVDHADSLHAAFDRLAIEILSCAILPADAFLDVLKIASVTLPQINKLASRGSVAIRLYAR